MAVAAILKIFVPLSWNRKSQKNRQSMFSVSSWNLDFIAFCSSVADDMGLYWPYTSVWKKYLFYNRSMVYLFDMVAYIIYGTFAVPQYIQCTCIFSFWMFFHSRTQTIVPSSVNKRICCFQLERVVAPTTRSGKGNPGVVCHCPPELNWCSIPRNFLIFIILLSHYVLVCGVDITVLTWHL